MPQTHRTPINRANAERQVEHWWTEERLHELERRAAAGEFAKMIALAMGTTRNAVIAKCNRAGFKLVGCGVHLAEVRGPSGRSVREEKRHRSKLYRHRRAAKLRRQIRKLQTQLAKLSSSGSVHRVSC